MTTATPAGFGPVMQLGYVVADLEATVRHWTETVGVGPFYLMDRIAFSELYLRGTPTTCNMRVAVAQWGEVQVELVHQGDDAPSIYTEYLRRSGPGLQHVGVMTDSVPRHLEQLAARGVQPVQWGETTTGVRFAYVDTAFHGGAMIELIESGSAIEGFFAMVRKAAATWDGSEPLRRLG